MAKILLVEDEANFGAVLRDILQMNDHRVTLVGDGERGWQAFQQESFDLCILDVMMPKLDGFALARRIQAADPNQPTMFLTARHQQEDVVKGLKIGADDYLTKPFHSEELLLRIAAILKRSQGRPQPAKQNDWSLGEFQFHPHLHLLTRADQEEKLSPKESDLLLLLLQYQNALLPREQALQQLWGEDNYFNSRSMDVFISKLRKRLKADPHIRIENVHGRGFRLVVGD